MLLPRFLLVVLMVVLGASLALAEAPDPPSPVIADIALDWSTHQRHALGSVN